MRSKRVIKAALVGGSACLFLSAAPLHAQTDPTDFINAQFTNISGSGGGANGLIIEPRVLVNAYPTSTLTITAPVAGSPFVNPTSTIAVPGFPDNINVKDTNAVGATGGANRDDILISGDGGNTADTIPTAFSFSISADVDITDEFNSPRKEAGIRINGTGGNLGNDALFIVDSDNHEVVAFGGPFYNFVSNGFPAYQTGETVLMSESYNASAGTLTYGAQDISGPTGSGLPFTSGPLPYTPPGASQVGLYAQWTPAAAPVPEPASLSMLVVGGFAFLARRRSKSLV
jgi:hypothetical protein